MEDRKQRLKVVRLTGKQRLIELGKDLLIAALTCSAVLLALQTPMLQQFQGLVAPDAATVTQLDAEQLDAAVIPYAITARNELGLYGVAYDQSQTERMFSALSPVLGEALSTASSAEAITRQQWLTLLEAPGVFCAFQWEPPIPVLSQALGGHPGELQGSAQALLLSWDGRQLWLAWQDGESYFRCAAQLDYTAQLLPLLETYTPNGAAFAASLAHTDAAYNTLDPSVPVTMTTPQGMACSALSPDFVNDSEALEQLLTALGFQSGVGSAYQAGSDLAITESGDRLRVSSAGGVTFHAGEDARYPVSDPTVSGAVRTCWQLLSRVVRPWKGETVYVLDRVETGADEWNITFQSRLQGIPVLCGANGWCARFTVSRGAIRDFTLTLREYSPTGTATVLPPVRLAAAALNSFPHSGRQLVLCYTDALGAMLTPSWVVREQGG